MEILCLPISHLISLPLLYMDHQNGTPLETHRETCVLCLAEKPLGLLDLGGGVQGRDGHSARTAASRTPRDLTTICGL